MTASAAAAAPIRAIYSEKGGVGKTALTTGVAAVLGDAGYTVLVVDLDPRATATDELGVTEPRWTVNDLLYVDPAPVGDPVNIRGLAADAITKAGKDWPGTVLVLPAERALANREADATTGLELRLRLALEGVPEALGIDLVMIDVPPRAGGKLAGAALLTARSGLVPVTLDEDGRVGAEQARRSLRTVAAGANPDLTHGGVVRNIVPGGRRTNLASEIETWLEEEYGTEGLLLPVVVPRHVVRQEVRFARLPITDPGADGREARALRAAYGAIGEHLLAA